MGVVAAAMMCALGAAAEEAPEAHRRLLDMTAYTVPRGTWRLGVFNLDYGLGEHTSVGVKPAYLLLGPNIKAKSTILSRPRIGLSIEAGALNIYNAWLSTIVSSDDSTLAMRVVPATARLSWKASERWSLHTGLTRTNTTISGELTGDQLTALLDAVIGSSIDLSSALGSDTLYANAQGRVTLGQSNLAIEWRRSEKSSFVLESNSYVFVSGLVVGTVSTANDTSSVGTGAAAAFELALTSFPTASSIAWHRHWTRANLRVGLPLSLRNPLSYIQPLSLYWLL